MRCVGRWLGKGDAAVTQARSQEPCGGQGGALPCSPVGVALSVVAAEAQVEVLAHVAVDPAAHDQPLAVVTGVFHVHHLMVVLVALGLGSAYQQTATVKKKKKSLPKPDHDSAVLRYQTSHQCPRLTKTSKPSRHPRRCIEAVRRRNASPQTSKALEIYPGFSAVTGTQYHGGWGGALLRKQVLQRSMSVHCRQR